MQSLLQKLNTDIVKEIEINDNTKVDVDNEDEGNSNGTNDDSIMQLQLQSDPNKYGMEDILLNDHEMSSNEVLHIE